MRLAPTRGLSPPRRGGRAALRITHEPEGLDQVDEIMVLEDGKVTQRGTRERLVPTGGQYCARRGPLAELA